MLNKELTVGQLAARSGVAVTALHFYETKGLIKSNRNAGNQRRFPALVLRSIAIIKVAQRTGIPLEEIKHAIDSDKELFCFFYGVTPELKQVPSKKNPEQTFGVFSANIENLDHFIVREAPGLA